MVKIKENKDKNSQLDYSESWIPIEVSSQQQADRLISLGKGVYKDRISGKLLYKESEMSTAEVVVPKKEKTTKKEEGTNNVNPTINANTWLDNFRKTNPKGYAAITKLAQENLQKKAQPGFYDANFRPTISKEEEERLKNNYYYVQALNGAMGSPYNMNQNSFNYNPNIASQQLQFGARYPISTIENAFEGGLGDATLNYIYKGVPFVLDKFGFFVPKPNSFTRGIGESVAGVRDLQRSGVIRGNAYGTEVSAKLFGKLYRKNRGNFKRIVDATGDESIAQKWYSRSLSEDEFYKLKAAEIKINSEYHPKSGIRAALSKGGYDRDFVRQFNTYDDYLKYLEETKIPTSLDDDGEALAYFYDDGRNPLTSGHDYAASNYGVRVNNASSYNPRIFEGHLHYSFPHAVKLNDPNVEVFKKVKWGPFSFTRRMNKNNILRGKFAEGGPIKKSYKDFATRLSKAWNNQDIRNQKVLGGNLFANGSWMPNKQWQNRIAKWEGASMYRPAPDTGRVNSSFQAEANRFLSVLPKKALQKLPDQAINALYSYSYNVGAGNFKKRVVPVLNRYLNGQASLQQLTNSMYATKDSQLRGLQSRRKYERGALEAAITGNDIMGTAAYNRYDPNLFNNNDNYYHTQTIPFNSDESEEMEKSVPSWNKFVNFQLKAPEQYKSSNNKEDQQLENNNVQQDTYFPLFPINEQNIPKVKNNVNTYNSINQINSKLISLGFAPYESLETTI